MWLGVGESGWECNSVKPIYDRFFAQQKRKSRCCDCSKYLAYSIENRVVGFGIHVSVVESFFR